MKALTLRAPVERAAALLQRSAASRARMYRISPIVARQVGKGGDNAPAPMERGGALSFPAVSSPFFQRFRDLEHEMESLMRGIGLAPLDNSFMPRNAMSLAVDVEDKGDAFVIHADVPGMTKDQVKIEVTPDHVLTIKGERKSEEKEEKGGMVRLERSYGSFARAFRLPEHVDVENIKAELHNGVLQLNVPKRDVEEPKKVISVKVSGE